MFRNYLVISIRNLLKNKFYLFINVIGLALALADCTVAYLNLEFAFGYDKFHEKLDKIYKVHVQKTADHGFSTYGIAPGPLGPAAAEDISAIKQMVRYNSPRMTIRKDDVILPKAVGFAEEGFLDMFTFPLAAGNANDFKSKKNIFLTKETAHIYFGDEDPLGQTITIINDAGDPHLFNVAGVFEKIQKNRTLNFDLLLHYDNYFEVNNYERNNWRYFTGATFFEIDTPEEAKTVEALLSNYLKVQNQARDDWKVAKYEIIPYGDFAMMSSELYSNWIGGGMHPAATYAPPVTAFLILLIACFNFTNTSLSMANKRLKEIGVRKVMGGGKKQLVIQFMSENLLIVFIALMVSLVISNYVVPAYGAMWENMELSLDLTQNYSFYLFLTGLLVFTAILAGSYPSFYVTKFNPVAILRGSMKIVGSSPLSRFLLAGQILLTISSIFTAFAFFQNAKFQEVADLGFNRETVVGIEMDNPEDYAALEKEFASNPKIESYAGTRTHLGRWNYSRTLKNSGQEIESLMLDFGLDYMDVMDMEIVKGRGFEDAFQQIDVDNSILVNERLVEMFGWEEPIGQRVAIDDSTHLTVVGVVKNFYHNGFWSKIWPYGIRLAKEDRFYFLVAKTREEDMAEVFGFMKEKWYQHVPNRPYLGFYQSNIEDIKEARIVNDNIVVISVFMALLSVILSGLGLFTLVSLNVLKRIKEIGIRKVLGAPIPQIIALINRPFTYIIIVGSLLGSIAGYYMTNIMMGSIFEYHKPFDIWTYSLPIAFVLVISFITSSTRILVAAMANPVKSLRYE